MEIEYFSETRHETDVIDLYRALKWYGLKGYTAEDIERAESNSFYSVYAYDGFKLVGMGRVASDGLTVAVMSGICVRDEYRRRGIGEQIVTRLVYYCQSGSYHMNVQLFCEDSLKPWYAKQGFTEFGMVMRKVMVYPEEANRLLRDFRDIYGIDRLIELDPDFYWNDLTGFTELKYYAALNSRGETVPSLLIQASAEEHGLTAELVFENVSNLNVGFDGTQTLLDGFDVICTDDLGLSTEKRYCIRTLYNGNMNFLCENFRIIDVKSNITPRNDGEKDFNDD